MCISLNDPPQGRKKIFVEYRFRHFSERMDRSQAVQSGWITSPGPLGIARIRPSWGKGVFIGITKMKIKGFSGSGDGPNSGPDPRATSVTHRVQY